MNELLDKAKLGDIEAFSKLIGSIEKDLEKLAASKLKDKSYVNDVLQNVYYKAYMKLYTLKDNEKFKSWIFTILRNECINTNKALARRKEVSLSSFGDVLEDAYSNNSDDKISFEQMISSLNEDEKKLLRMKFEENFSNRDISEELGIPYNTVKSKINRAIKKITLIALIIVLFSGFAVLAVYVVKQIKAHFTTSLNAIDAAVENNYVQEIDSDFVYDNGIGVKVDAIILDDKNLDISFVYDVVDKEKYGDITGIRIREYIIGSDNQIIINSKKNNNTNLVKISKQGATKLEVIENYYRNSILFLTYNSFPKINKLKFNIKSISIKDNNKINIINGNWNLENNVIDILNTRIINSYYMVGVNNYVESATAILTDTSIKFDIDLNVKLNNSDVQKIILYNNENKFNWVESNFSSNNHLKIVFDLGKFNDNIDDLNLEIPINGKENIILKFRRDL